MRRVKSVSNFTVDLNKIIENADIMIGTHQTFNMRYYNRIKDMEIGALELTPRSYNCLARAKITKVRQVVDGWDELPKIRQMGLVSVKEIKNAVLALYYDTLSTEEKTQFWKDTFKGDN